MLRRVLGHHCVCGLCDGGRDVLSEERHTGRGQPPCVPATIARSAGTAVANRSSITAFPCSLRRVSVRPVALTTSTPPVSADEPTAARFSAVSDCAAIGVSLQSALRVSVAAHRPAKLTASREPVAAIGRAGGVVASGACTASSAPDERLRLRRVHDARRFGDRRH